ncbi:MAG TPA: Appr-1-p processing protein, partial [Actinobacteria bacterium]|nr:Appr-1-p processing protein [Actinomycetota bacterium]
MITPSRGNLLDAEADALVNTVNTVGVMGKGIALQFKKAFPANFKAYERACKAGSVKLGKMFVFDNGALTRPKYVINFPTKKHWKSRSRIADIATGLEDLGRVIEELGLESIAVPPLGCGNGGLDWAEVRPLIESVVGELDGVNVLLFAPTGTPEESTMRVATDRPKMTAGRAALISVVARYLRAAET